MHPFDNMAINHWVKNRSKTERQAVTLWDTNLWSSFCDPYWELICRNKWYSRTSEIPTPPQIALGTFMCDMTLKLPWYYYLLTEKSHWLLLPTLYSLLSGDTVQPENTYSCTFKVTGQVWEHLKNDKHQN